MYKVFTPIITITLIAGAILLLGNVGLLFVPFDAIPAQIISHLALSTLALIMIIGIGKKAYDRYKMSKKIVRRLDKILIADCTSDGRGKEFALSYETLMPTFGWHLEAKLRNAAFRLHLSGIIPTIKEKSLEPYVLVKIKNKGDVEFSRHGKKIRAKGLSYGHECEVELLNPVSTYSLIEHEVGHVILSNTPLKRNANMHHKIMAKAGF